VRGPRRRGRHLQGIADEAVSFVLVTCCAQPFSRSSEVVAVSGLPCRYSRTLNKTKDTAEKASPIAYWDLSLHCLSWHRPGLVALLCHALSFLCRLFNGALIEKSHIMKQICTFKFFLVLCGGLGLVFVVCLLFWPFRNQVAYADAEDRGPTSHSTEIEMKPFDLGETGRALLGLRTMREVGAAFDPDHTLSVVEFSTKRTRQGQADHLGRPSLGLCWTGQTINHRGVLGIRVVGQFSLRQKLQHSPPVLGKIDEKIQTPAGNQDPVFRRLEPLLECCDHKDSLLFLAVWPKDATEVLQATFIGPLTGADVWYLGQMSKAFQQRRFSGLAPQEAAKLLNSTNPQLVWLGLARLQELGRLKPAHFHQALQSLPIKQIPAAVRELCLAALFPESRHGIEAALLSPRLSPQKQVLVLETLMDFLKVNRHGARDVLDQRKVRLAAKKLRTAAVKASDAGQLIRQLDRLSEVHW
jgi:hypothetical protein